MLRIETTLLLIAAIAFGGCANKIRVKSSYDEGTNFGTYKTFAVTDPPKTAQGMPAYSEITGRTVNEAITANLQERGMSAASWDEADLQVSFRVGGQQKTEVWDSSVGWYGGSETWSKNYVTGSLVIEMVDRAQNKLVWHGWGSKDMFSQGKGSQQERNKRVTDAVNTVLKKYPPK